MAAISAIGLIVLISVPGKIGFLLFAPLELCAYYLAYRRRMIGVLPLVAGAFIEAYVLAKA